MALTQETRQALFEKAVNGLMAQRAYGYDVSEGGCSYYAQNNGKVVRCAVGLLVSEDEAKVLQKDASLFFHLFQSLPSARKIFKQYGVTTIADAGFVTALQEEHDSLASAGRCTPRDFNAVEFLTAMRKFGKKRKMDVSFIEALMKKEDEA